jgi:hypothetical protein
MKFKSIALVFMLLAVYGLEAWGQSTSGMFGQRSIGSSLSMGASGFTGSSMGGLSMGSTGMGGMGGMGGMSSMGGMGSMSGMGSTGMGGMSGMSGMGSSGMGGMSSGLGSTMGTTQAGQFIGANTGQTAFIGANTQAGQTQNMGMGRTTQNSFGSSTGQFGQFGGMRQNNQFGQMGYGQGGYGMQNTNTQNQLKFTRRLDIENAPISSSAGVSSGLNQLLMRTMGSHSPSSIEASYQGRTVVLKGVVATARDRDLAAKLIRLEPGVDQVQNELVVKQAETPDSRQ